MNKISIVEKRIVAISGPIGKFVLEKQIRDMGETPETFPDSG